MKRVLLLALIAGCSEAHAVTPKKLEQAEVAVPPRLPLNERLAQEAASRPAHTVRPEQLIEALGKQVTVTRHRQVLASPVEAAYCESLSTAKGLAFSLCEYGDADAAERGLARSKTAFDALIPDRTLDTHMNTLLTVMPGEERELVRRSFASLR